MEEKKREKEEKKGALRYYVYTAADIQPEVSEASLTGEPTPLCKEPQQASPLALQQLVAQLLSVYSLPTAFALYNANVYLICFVPKNCLPAEVAHGTYPATVSISGSTTHGKLAARLALAPPRPAAAH